MEPHVVDAVQATPADGGTFALWTGLIGPPFVFLAALGASYLFSHWACHLGPGWLVYAVSPTALVAIAACALPLRRASGDRSAGSPRRFLGRVGLLSSVLFALAVVALGLPRLFLDPCAQY